MSVLKHVLWCNTKHQFHSTQTVLVRTRAAIVPDNLPFCIVFLEKRIFQLPIVILNALQFWNGNMLGYVRMYFSYERPNGEIGEWTVA